MSLDVSQALELDVCEVAGMKLRKQTNATVVDHNTGISSVVRADDDSDESRPGSEIVLFCTRSGLVGCRLQTVRARIKGDAEVGGGTHFTQGRE